MKRRFIRFPNADVRFKYVKISTRRPSTRQQPAAAAEWRKGNLPWQPSRGAARKEDGRPIPEGEGEKKSVKPTVHPPVANIILAAVGTERIVVVNYKAEVAKLAISGWC